MVPRRHCKASSWPWGFWWKAQNMRGGGCLTALHARQQSRCGGNGGGGVINQCHRHQRFRGSRLSSQNIRVSLAAGSSPKWPDDKKRHQDVCAWGAVPCCEGVYLHNVTGNVFTGQADLCTHWPVHDFNSPLGACGWVTAATYGPLPPSPPLMFMNAEFQVFKF